MDTNERSVGVYVPTVTLGDVWAAKPRIIFHSVATCWWTHRRGDLCTRQESRLPCDPRGGVLVDEVIVGLKEA